MCVCVWRVGVQFAVVDEILKLSNHDISPVRNHQEKQNGIFPFYSSSFYLARRFIFLIWILPGRKEATF